MRLLLLSHCYAPLVHQSSRSSSFHRSQDETADLWDSVRKYGHELPKELKDASFGTESIFLAIQDHLHVDHTTNALFPTIFKTVDIVRKQQSGSNIPKARCRKFLDHTMSNVKEIKRLAEQAPVKKKGAINYSKTVSRNFQLASEDASKDAVISIGEHAKQMGLFSELQAREAELARREFLVSSEVFDSKSKHLAKLQGDLRPCYQRCSTTLTPELCGFRRSRSQVLSPGLQSMRSPS